MRLKTLFSPFFAIDLRPNSPPLKDGALVHRYAIVTMFLSSVERRFSVPAASFPAVAHSLGQGGPKGTGAAGAQRP